MPSTQAPAAAPRGDVAPMTALELAGIMGKPPQSCSNDDVARLLVTPPAVFLELIQSDQPNVLPADMLRQVMKTILEVNKVWVWPNMSDTMRIKFSRLVQKHKASRQNRRGMRYMQKSMRAKCNSVNTCRQFNMPALVLQYVLFFVLTFALPTFIDFDTTCRPFQLFSRRSAAPNFWTAWVSGLLCLQRQQRLAENADGFS